MVCVVNWGVSLQQLRVCRHAMPCAPQNACRRMLTATALQPTSQLPALMLQVFPLKNKAEAKNQSSLHLEVWEDEEQNLF